MTNSTFNILEYNKKLKAAGVPEEQADLQANAIYELIEEKLVTKEDLRAVKEDLHKDMSALATKVELKDMQISLIKWMVGLMSGWSVILISVMTSLKIFH